MTTLTHPALSSFSSTCALGIATSMHFLLGIACVWMAHIGFDRLLGYGLKYATGFGETHLGRRGAPDPSGTPFEL